MQQRPFFQKSIVELRALFEKFKDNEAELAALAFELSKRKVQKAAILSQQVKEALQVLARSTPVERQIHQAPKLDRPATSAAPSLQGRNETVIAQSSVEFSDLDGFIPPGRKDDPAAILSAWTAFEALSPQSYKRPEDLASGERSRVVPLSGADLPWRRGLKAKPKHRLFFQIVLGSIALDRATDLLVEAFGEDEERSRPDGKKAVIGAILIDKDGYLLEDKAIAVSSFAWALRPALERKLGHL